MSDITNVPTHVQRLLEIVGFYGTGFCSGHCEHAPLRESNPVLNTAIEAWHDQYYSGSNIIDRSTHVDLSDYLTGEPDLDWRAVAMDLVKAIQAFSPEKWIMESGLDLSKFLQHQADWFENDIVPSVNRFYDVYEEYKLDEFLATDEPDPF
jgi:hypothetical protein